MALYRDQAVVLRTIKLGESDRIVSLATEAHGKIRAVAKGIRKTKSRFGGRLEPVTHVALQLYEGRQLDTITQADTLDHFRTIRDDLTRVSKATALLEAVDHVMQEHEPNRRAYQMLVGALRTLAARDAALLVPAFYLKLLAAEGFRPMLDRCVTCGERADLVAFDMHEGGLLCRACRRGTGVSSEVIELLRRILGGGLTAALDEQPSRATREVDALATTALEHHIERRLRAVQMLDRAAPAGQ